MPIYSGPLTAEDVIALWEGTPDGTLYLSDDGDLEAPAGGGGGYAKLVASGPNGGILTLHDDTPTTGETRFVIREGADTSGFENLFEIQSIAGSPQVYIGGVNNGFTMYLQGMGLRDANERYFAISSSGIRQPSDGRIGFCSDQNVFSGLDAYFGRSDEGVIDVLTTGDALATLRVAALEIFGGPLVAGANDSDGAGLRTISAPNA